MELKHLLTSKFECQHIKMNSSAQLTLDQKEICCPCSSTRGFRSTPLLSNCTLSFHPQSSHDNSLWGTIVDLHKTCRLGTRHKGQFTATFYVTDAKGPVLIGLPTCQALGLVSLNFTVLVTSHQPPTQSNV